MKGYTLEKLLGWLARVVVQVVSVAHNLGTLTFSLLVEGDHIVLEVLGQFDRHLYMVSLDGKSAIFIFVTL